LYFQLHKFYQSTFNIVVWTLSRNWLQKHRNGSLLFDFQILHIQIYFFKWLFWTGHVVVNMVISMSKYSLISFDHHVHVIYFFTFNVSIISYVICILYHNCQMKSFFHISLKYLQSCINFLDSIHSDSDRVWVEIWNLRLLSSCIRFYILFVMFYWHVSKNHFPVIFFVC